MNLNIQNMFWLCGISRVWNDSMYIYMLYDFMTAATEIKDFEAPLTYAEYVLAALTVWQRNQSVFHSAS